MQTNVLDWCPCCSPLRSHFGNLEKSSREQVRNAFFLSPWPKHLCALFSLNLEKTSLDLAFWIGMRINHTFYLKFSLQNKNTCACNQIKTYESNFFHSAFIVLWILYLCISFGTTSSCVIYYLGKSNCNKYCYMVVKLQKKCSEESQFKKLCHILSNKENR